MTPVKVFESAFLVHSICKDRANSGTELLALIQSSEENERPLIPLWCTLIYQQPSSFVSFFTKKPVCINLRKGAVMNRRLSSGEADRR